MNHIVKRYCDSPLGQVHYRLLEPRGDKLHRPLVCLHPAPSSGMYFTTVMPLLNAGRRIVAPDYPGYGSSDSLDSEPGITDYASAMMCVTEDAGGGEPVDVLGFHTGCLVAAEMALAVPDKIGRLVLCDVPYFDRQTQAGLREQMARPMPITDQLESLAGPWKFNIESRIGSVAIDRAFELFAEHLRAGRNDYVGFDAAFSYDCVTRFSELRAETVVLATKSGLRDASIEAAGVIRDAELVMVDEVTTAVFESGAEAIAKRILEAIA